MACTFCDDEKLVTIPGDDGMKEVECWMCKDRTHPFQRTHEFETEHKLSRDDPGWHKQ